MTLRLKSYSFLLRFLHYLLPSVAFGIAAYVRFVVIKRGPHPANADPRFYLAVLFFATVVWILVSEYQGLCDIDHLFREHTGTRKSIGACVTTYTALSAMLFFYRQQNFSRIFFLVSAVALLVITVASRLALRKLLQSALRERRAIRVLIVGADEHAQRTARRLGSVPVVLSKVVGYLHIDGEVTSPPDSPVFHIDDIGSDRLPAFDEIVIAARPDQLSSIGALVSALEILCVPTRLALDLGGLPVVRERLFQFGELQLLDLATTPVESPAYFLLKRAFDIVFSLTALLLMSPVMLVTAMAIKLSSPGPVFFRQERVGLNGQPFVMFKFRTMRVAAPAESDTCWTVRDDQRRTAVGRFLRKTSMDELPQFLNVLKGDMSVVGPRPERPHFVKRFLAEISHYDSRHRLKVGITGWAQVNGWRGDSSIQKRFEFDLYYLQNWSFWLDLRIILLTAWSGMFGSNAY